MNFPTLLLIAAPAIFAAVAYFTYRWRHTQPKGWHIGPRVNGRNYSHGMPGKPTLTDTGWKFDLPPGANIHAVTHTPDKPLTGSIRARYRVTLNGAKLKPQQPDLAAFEPKLSLYFQRRGDDWTGVGKFGTYRWFSTTLFPMTEGEHVAELPIDLVNFQGVLASSDLTQQALDDACNDCWQVGVGFGSAGGQIHGLETDRTITFEMLEFSVS